MKNDRIHQAWQLRFDLHAWIKANPKCTIYEVFAAFPENPAATVRKAIQRLRTDSNVAMLGLKGKAGRLTATTETIRPESEVRKVLADAARRTIGNLQKWNRRRYASDKQDRFDRAFEFRQNILDYMNTYGDTTTSIIAHVMNVRVDHANRTMRNMADAGELLKIGSRKDVSYRAIATETASADYTRDQMMHRKIESLKQYNAEREAERKALEEAETRGRYVHAPGKLNNGFPISGQGGQGAVRREFGIQASAGMI